MKDLRDSIIRTLTPVIVGAILGWLASINLPVDDGLEPALIIAITGAFQALYYIAVRLVETYVTPKFGWLLGLKKEPLYVQSDTPVLE